jgi:hypothetical protein
LAKEQDPPPRHVPATYPPGDAAEP